MPNYSGTQYLALEATAKALLTMHPGRGSEVIFTTIANAWYAEKDVTCKSPNLPLSEFGKMLGMSTEKIDRARTLARHRAESVRRVQVGGNNTLGNGTRCVWLYVPGKGRVYA